MAPTQEMPPEVASGAHTKYTHALYLYAYTYLALHFEGNRLQKSCGSQKPRLAIIVSFIEEVGHFRFKALLQYVSTTVCKISLSSQPQLRKYALSASHRQGAVSAATSHFSVKPADAL